MTRRTERFKISGSPRLFMRLPAGEARVVAGEEGVVEVRLAGREATLERFLVEDRAGQIVIEPESGRVGRWSGVDVEIRLGGGADIHARLASGDVAIETEIATLVVEAGSGDVAARGVSGDARIKTAAGDVAVSSVGGRLTVAAASGDLRVGSAARDVNAKTASGDIRVEEVAGSFIGHAASGDVEVGRFSGELFQVKTLSGDVRVGVAPGRTFTVDFQSLSGDVRTEFPVQSMGGDAEPPGLLSVKTMSGDIVVTAATHR